MCALEELKVIVSNLYDWMANSYLPWGASSALMACCLGVLGKRLGVHPIGIRETLFRDLSKFVLRAAGDKEKTACGNLQVCTVLEASIEGVTHSVVKR